jgi:tyrosine-protein phosphatase SIW14
VSGWELSTIIDEYRTYAEPKVRDCDVKYITDFTLSDLSNLWIREATSKFRVRSFLRTLIVAFFILAVWIFSSVRMTAPSRRNRETK